MVLAALWKFKKVLNVLAFHIIFWHMCFTLLPHQCKGQTTTILKAVIWLQLLTFWSIKHVCMSASTMYKLANWSLAWDFCIPGPLPDLIHINIEGKCSVTLLGFPLHRCCLCVRDEHVSLV